MNFIPKKKEVPFNICEDCVNILMYGKTKIVPLIGYKINQNMQARALLNKNEEAKIIKMKVFLFLFSF